MRKLLIVLLCLHILAGAAAAEIETTSTVRLRTGPDTEHRVIATVPKGTVLNELYCVMYDAQERPWHWVEWEGQDCWVCGDYAIKTGEKRLGASNGDPLAETRWIAVSLLDSDGAEVYPADFGGSELWLFPDGTAHWQVFNGEGYLSRSPVGHWERTGNDSLVFYRTESLEASEERQTQRFEVTPEGLLTPWSSEITISLVQYDFLDRWLPLSRDRLLGDWVMYSGETEGRRYTAAEEGINATIRFTEAPNGNLFFDYRRNDTVKRGTAEYSINGLSNSSDLITAWAPWYLCMDLRENERTRIFLLNHTLLRVERFYYLDGTPVVSTQDYVRQD